MNHDLHKTLIVIAGPTASGKTAAAIKLAQHFNAAVVSADSRQFFREMSIGTAKPTEQELAAAPHYFINSHSINDAFSVGDYERECLALLDKLFRDTNVVILAGGSGLYIKAITQGFDSLPATHPGIRDMLNSQLAISGIAALQERLKAIDPVYYNEVDLNNPQRLIRALEVYESTGKAFSSYRTAGVIARPFRIIKLGLNMPREQLYDRINRRVDLMVRDGLANEVRELLPYRHLNALNTVGYTELFDHFEGKCDLESAIAAIKQNTRRFAKRQLTWFRKDKDIIWFDAGATGLVDMMLASVQEQLGD